MTRAMRNKYCRKQFQVAKTVVLVSGIILMVMWASYLTYPAIFKSAKVHLMPSKFLGLHYLFGVNGNSSDNITATTPNFESHLNSNGIDLEVDLEESKESSNTLNESKSDVSVYATTTQSLDARKTIALKKEGESGKEDGHDSVASTTISNPSPDAETTTTSLNARNTNVIIKEDESSKTNDQVSIASTAARAPHPGNETIPEIYPDARNTNATVKTGESTTEGERVSITSNTEQGKSQGKSDKVDVILAPDESSNENFVSAGTQFPATEKHTTVKESPTTTIYTVSSLEATKEITENGNVDDADVEENENRKHTTGTYTSTQVVTVDGHIGSDNPIERGTDIQKTKVTDNKVQKNNRDTTTTPESSHEIVNQSMMSNKTYSNSDKAKNKADTTTINGAAHSENVSGNSAPEQAEREINDKRVPQDSPYIGLNMCINEREVNHTILLWNEPNCIKEASIEMDMGDCEYNNCQLTTDHLQFDISSAVVLHPFVVDDNIIPLTRDPDQVWILHHLHPPTDLNFLGSLGDVFNWTWSYRPTADIFHSYGALLSNTISTKKSYSDIFRRKKISAVFFSKECSVPSIVEDTIGYIRSYFPVDIFTACDEPPVQNLEELINDKYTFYLGFEDSLCEDYITEQFFHYFKLDVVVVVMGWGRYDLLPNGSFVNTHEFPRVKELGEYLFELGSNENMYISYLKKKDQYEVKEANFMYKNALCNICERLNNLERHQRIYSEKELEESLGRCSTAGTTHLGNDKSVDLQ